jgi:hypothetical protein
MEDRCTAVDRQTRLGCIDQSQADCRNHLNRKNQSCTNCSRRHRTKHSHRRLTQGLHWDCKNRRSRPGLSLRKLRRQPTRKIPFAKVSPVSALSLIVPERILHHPCSELREQRDRSLCESSTDPERMHCRPQVPIREKGRLSVSRLCFHDLRPKTRVERARPRKR